MIRHAWTVICEKSIIDIDTNNISLDVLEQLNMPNLLLPPEAEGIILPTQLEAVSLWYRSPSDLGEKVNGRLRVEVTGHPETQPPAHIEIDLTESCRLRTRVRSNTLSIPKNFSGNFYFVTEIQNQDDWIEVSRIPVEIKIGTFEKKY